MRKLAKIIMAGALAVTVMGITANADEIKVWVADNVVDFTNGQIEAFKEANPDYADYDYVVEPVGEGDAAGNMITDVEAGADIYGFAQDQIARLVSAGALIDVEPENAEKVKAENDPGSVAAATVGDTLYAYPLTSDNGYFLYYDKSVVTDPSSLEAIVADCEAAGKNFYMEINSGWYQTAFFFATGADLTYDTDDQGNFTACNTNYASDEGQRLWKGDFPCRLLGLGKPGYVFEEGPRRHQLKDPVLGRTLDISYENNLKFVLFGWTPDFSALGGSDDPAFGRHFVCVEGGTLYRDRAYLLRPGETHRLAVTIAAR